MTVIKGLLAEKGLSVHALHKRIGGNRTKIYEVANGFSKATKPQKERIAFALGKSVEILFDGNGMGR